jgi:hypothetical protein
MLTDTNWRSFGRERDPPSRPDAQAGCNAKPEAKHTEYSAATPLRTTGNTKEQ